jgi:signal peptidase II
LIDRLRVGHVIDFIDVHLPFTLPYILPYGRWPAFNIADSAIVIGMFVYLFLNVSDATKKIH